MSEEDRETLILNEYNEDVKKVVTEALHVAVKSTLTRDEVESIIKGIVK